MLCASVRKRNEKEMKEEKKQFSNIEDFTA
jgi:hypothetical protein